MCVLGFGLVTWIKLSLVFRCLVIFPHFRVLAFVVLPVFICAEWSSEHSDIFCLCALLPRLVFTPEIFSEVAIRMCTHEPLPIDVSFKRDCEINGVVVN